MIELGTKYDYNAFRTEGTRRLYQYVSTSLRKIDRHAAASAGIPQQSQSPSVVEGTTLLHSISLINIARRHNLKKFVLVCAFYMCAQMDPTVLLDGITRRDGTQEKLSLEDFKCSLRGAQKLQEAKLTATYSVLSLSQDCRTPRKCSIAHTDILTEITRNKKLMTTSNCLLLGRGIKPLMIRGAQAGDLCQRCFAKVESITPKCKEYWFKLPDVLGLAHEFDEGAKGEWRRL